MIKFNWKFLPGCDILATGPHYGVYYRIIANGDGGTLVRWQDDLQTEICVRDVQSCMDAAVDDYINKVCDKDD